MCDQYSKLERNISCAEKVKDVRYITERVKLMLDRLDMGPISRHRRSIFDGVGKLSKFLFGTMDQEDSDQISIRLRNLETDNKQNLELLKEQVSLVKSNYDNTREKFDKLEVDLNETKIYTTNVIRIFKSQISSVMSETNSIQARVTLDEATSSIVIHLQEIEHQINTISIILSTLATKHLHPLILSYKQISQFLKDVPLSFELSTVMQDPFMLQQLAYVESSHVEDHLFVKISVPLIEKGWFSLKKAYSLPIPLEQNLFLHYEIEEEYLASDAGGNKLILLKEEQLKSCQKISLSKSEKGLVCHFSSPIYTTPKNNCLLLLFKGWSEANDFCTKIPIRNNHNILVKMNAENSWLYNFLTETDIILKCTNFETTLRITQSGILTLKPNCQAKIDNLLLVTTNTFTKTVEVSEIDVMPKIDFQPFRDIFKSLSSENITTGIHIKNYKEHKTFLKEKHNEFNILLQKIGKIQEDRDARFREKTHNITFGVVGVVPALVIIIVFTIYKLCRQRPKFLCTSPFETMESKIPSVPNKETNDEVKNQNPLAFQVKNPSNHPREKDRPVRSKPSEFEII